jgi:hypothetical protein
MRLEPLISHTGEILQNLELLIDKTSSIYLYVKLKALASWIFLSFTSFSRNSDSYEYTNKSARRGAQFVPIHKAFSHRNYGSKCVVLGYNYTYFSNKIHKGKTCYSEEQVISMLEFLIDNIFEKFYELFLLSGFLICHAVNEMIFWWNEIMLR